MQYDFGRLRSTSLMLCISNEKCIEYNLNRYINKSKDFLSFLKEMVESLKKLSILDEKYLLNRICLIMDNAAIHKTKIIRDYLNKMEIKCLFLPPYHPEINPVEFAFRFLKQKCYRRSFISV